MTATVYKWAYGYPLVLLSYHGPKAEKHAIDHAKRASAEWCYGTTLPAPRPFVREVAAQSAPSTRLRPNWDRKIENEN